MNRVLPATSLLLALVFSSCTTWQPTPLSPRQLIEAERPAEVRVTTTAGERLTLIDPELTGDSLTSRSRATTALAPADIQTLEVRRFSTGRTLGFLAILAGAYGVIGTALAEGWIGSGFQ